MDEPTEPHLDKAIKELIVEFEEEIELYKTYGGS
jgi:hypothetical protein